MSIEDVAFGRELGRAEVLWLRDGGMDSITHRIDFATAGTRWCGTGKDPSGAVVENDQDLRTRFAAVMAMHRLA